MKTQKPLLLLVVGTALVVTTAHAQDKAPDPALLAKARVTHADAQKTALQTVPNATVKESELEEEDGGLRWSFDLKTPGSKKITEVGIDAVTGKVVENKVESDKEEGKEKDGEEEKPRHNHR